VIKYREKTKKAGAMLAECLALREMAAKAGATFLVNDHLDVALLCDADGVHLGQEDIPPPAARKLLGPHKIIGLSTHSPAQAQAAQASGMVDYIGVGPIFATATKKDVCEPVGLEYLEYVAEKIDLPFVAIGGIKEHNIALVRGRGAKTICMVTEIAGAKDIAAKTRTLLRMMGR